MSTVRCKFKLDTIQMRRSHMPLYEKQADGTQKHVGYGERIVYDAEFQAVYGGTGQTQDSDNQKFWEATPSGNLKLTTINMMPWENFLGKEFYLDIVPAGP